MKVLWKTPFNEQTMKEGARYCCRNVLVLPTFSKSESVVSPSNNHDIAVHENVDGLQ